MVALAVAALAVSVASAGFTAWTSWSTRTQVRHAREQADAAFHQVLTSHLAFEARLEGESGTYQLFLRCVEAPGGHLTKVVVVLPSSFYAGYGVGVSEGAERVWGAMSVNDELWQPVIRNASNPSADTSVRVEASWRPTDLGREVATL